MKQMHQTQTVRGRKRWIAAALLGLAVIMLPGCLSEPVYHDYAAFVSEPKPLVTSTEYRLAPPDTITITSKRVREINGHTETIRPDGKITLPLLGSLFVAGRTVEDVSAEIEMLAKDYYEDADASLRVSAFRSKKIFVFGEVGAPGPYPYTGTNTVLGTMAQAQPTRLANPQKIHILRPDSDGEMRKRMTINLDKMVKMGDTALDAVLEEGDIIFVPPSALAKIGLTFQQLLLPLQPIAQTVQAPSNIYDNSNRNNYNEGGN